MQILIVAGMNSSLINFRGELIDSWKAMGHHVVAAAPGNEAKEELEARGVQYVEIPLSRTGLNPLKDIGGMYALVKLFRKEWPDLAFLYTVKPVIYGSFAARTVKTCRVYSLMTGLGYLFSGDSFLRKLVRRLSIFMYRLALRRNTLVFFQNPDDRRCFEQWKIVPSEKTELVNGSGVNLERFSPAPLPKDTVTFLLIARLIWDKGIREYVEAARLVKKVYPQIRFLLVGPFDENPHALGKEEVASWVREGIIDYRGKTDDVRPVLAESSVYVLPSYREGTPRSVIEAMAMGRPVITTDAPGCRETVVDGVNGFFVPVKNVEKLVEVMETFIREPELIPRMGRHSRKFVAEKYDVHAVNETINAAMGLLGRE